MKIIAVSLLGLSCVISNLSLAGEHITIRCQSSQADCPKIPPPPPPPETPVMPPACLPKEPLSGFSPKQIPQPSVPSEECLRPPTPPAIPPVPEMPAQTHKACANKKEGTIITWQIDSNSEMTGVCVKKDGKMIFNLDHAEISDHHPNP